jgi:hypothetical protein
MEFEVIQIKLGGLNVGGEPWFYWVPYQPNIGQALHDLREREFRAGRYYPAMAFPEFPLDSASPAPGAQHASILEAMQAADAEGTRSILDMERVGDQPGYGVVAPVSSDVLIRCYGTLQPTRQMIEENPLYANVDRGQGIYVIAYKDGQPSEIFFAGCSYD